MSDALWWLPSLVVFGVAAVAAVVGVAGARRVGAARARQALAAARHDEVAAKGLIVRADEAVREAEREAGFVEARFGEDAARRYRAEVARAAASLRDALRLQQRLDDAEPDTAVERREWSARIASLCTATLDILTAADGSVAGVRDAEQGAAERLPALRALVARMRVRHADATVVADGLGGRYAPSALAGARDALDRAAGAVAEAAAAVDGGPATTGAAAPGVSAGEVDRAATLLDRAERDLAIAEGLEAVLLATEAQARDASAVLDADLSAARGELDEHGRDGDAADPRLAVALEELGRAVAAGSAALAPSVPASPETPAAARAPAPTAALADPAARRDRLRAARDRLEVARAEVRRASGRLDGARSALGGAIAIAEHAIAAASEVVDRGRGKVGADARTRLADAERQLVLARQEPDPVAALDAARRAAARAADADALARYDLGGGLGIARG